MADDANDLPVNLDAQQQDLRAFVAAVESNDVAATTRLLQLPHVRAHVNAPLFAFGQRAVHIAARNIALLDVLLEDGADLQLKSDWENGPYTVIDQATEESARYLIARGAMLTPNAAARLGWIDDLRQLLDADPSAAHARGGDGQTPLHEAKTVAITDLLLERGATIDARCVDHQSTPAQYALAERPDVCRRLLDRGAEPDIFMAARLGDTALGSRLLDANPDAIEARINDPGYAPVPPFNIYCWTLGFLKSPHEVALAYGHRDVYELFVSRSPVRVAFIDAAMRADEPEATALLTKDASLMSSLTRADHGRVAQAIFNGRYAAAALMLRLGFDESVGAGDGASALHCACWVGHVGLVQQLIARGRVPLDLPDPSYLSPPLGWAAYGSAQRRAVDGDYVAVIDRLVAAGANIHAPGNRQNESLIGMADGNTRVQDALRRHGAKR